MEPRPAEIDARFEQLYASHHGWLRAWIRRRLECADQACDLAQDVFIRVLTQRRPDELREPRAYLSSIARSLMVDMFRRHSIEQAYADALAVRAEVTEPSPEVRHQVIQTLLEIDRLLDELGERPREIFLRVQLDGLSLAEVGRQMGLSANTVRKHFIRAMARCLALIDD
ncbi:sigma-70 family RNA polymerase sigma factor [Thauera linaloolentis]|uniref:ECF subfamily RNA polymerase sigma-24 factor n=1 Tax=Thauera linaloolentis (strain DSM 12138 / JCM 21573 / CCUG 41526 / CIP 105981 / IAM 15112 / NBRC 102519 / 47Lol) TaxID=1123367 RepID=N6Z307_THAL4|nr:sigma-70 family RNA polymerase sigma factor [Thauera linaloolentis]ENO88753.1 ECF subfamily RNA polymerase sigma-24 factor [Thauera linaloolentis 47Lol = DSM 12138]MCM8564938.1 sigma-70 family RNA polymerase sigma factor [Thauera linaloolentis]